MAKKYYWLKLNEGFFRDKKIKKLRRIAGGDTFTIIYLKMQLLSLKTEGKLLFEGVEENFVDEIALEIDEDPDNVAVTVRYLMSNGLLEESETDSYILPEAIKSMGSEGSSAARVRKHREKKKALEGGQALPEPEEKPKALQCNTDETKCNTEIEKEKEIEKDIEIETDKQTDIEKDPADDLTPRQRERVDLLKDLFVGWSVSDYQIFYISTKVSDKIPYDPMDGPNGMDIKIYDYLDDLIMRAKIDKVQNIYRWLLKVIPEVD